MDIYAIQRVFSPAVRMVALEAAVDQTTGCQGGSFIYVKFEEMRSGDDLDFPRR
jgi:hypothetical protein